MAIVGSYTTPATAPIALYTLITHLVARGAASKVADSDGTTYSSSGTRITSGASGANGLANNSAWFILRQTGSTREWCFQRGTTNLLWRIKVSVAGFSAGSPSATQVPSATDELVLQGGGTDASPTFSTLFDADGTYRWCVGADNAASWGWFAAAWTSGGSACKTFLLFDPLLASTFPAGNTEPYVYRAVWATSGGVVFAGSPTAGSSNGVNNSYTANSGNPVIRYAATATGGANWRPLSAGAIGLYTPATIGAGSSFVSTSAYGGGEGRGLLVWARDSATQGGILGCSSILSIGTASRSTGDTLTDFTRYDLRLDALYAAWDSTPVLV